VGPGWAQAIDGLLTAADAYIIIDTPTIDPGLPPAHPDKW